MSMPDEEYVLAVRESDMAQLEKVEKYAQWLYDAHFCNGETQVTQYDHNRMVCNSLDRYGVRVEVWSMLENESPNFLDDVRVIDIVDTKEIAVYKLTVCRRFFEQWLSVMKGDAREVVGHRLHKPVFDIVTQMYDGVEGVDQFHYTEDVV